MEGPDHLGDVGNLHVFQGWRGELRAAERPFTCTFLFKVKWAKSCQFRLQTHEFLEDWRATSVVSEASLNVISQNEPLSSKSDLFF